MTFWVDVFPLVTWAYLAGILNALARVNSTAAFALPRSAGAVTLILRVLSSHPTIWLREDPGMTLIGSVTVVWFMRQAATAFTVQGECFTLTFAIRLEKKIVEPIVLADEARCHMKSTANSCPCYFCLRRESKPPRRGGGEYGEGGIRTRGTVARTLDFQSSTLSRSATSPVDGADIV